MALGLFTLAGFDIGYILGPGSISIILDFIAILTGKATFGGLPALACRPANSHEFSGSLTVSLLISCSHG